MRVFNPLKKIMGTYLLLLEIFQDIDLNINSRKWVLSQGYYLYFGSAKGNTSTSLGYRLKRHFDIHKKKYWHIDYLTTHPHVQIVQAFYNTDLRLTECMNFENFSFKYPIKKIMNFGNSDCRNNCGSHLGYIQKDEEVIRDITTCLLSEEWNVLGK